MEILFPDQPLFSDLRRAYIDRDLSSVFRIQDYLWDANFDDERRAILEQNLYSVFRILADHPDINDDLRKATLENNLWSLFRLFDPDASSIVSDMTFPHDDIDPMDFKKVIMNDNVWSLYRVLLNIQDTQIVRAIKSLHASGTRFDKDALSQGQLRSKMWLINELKDIDADLGTVFLCAGWYGILSVLMFENGLKINRVRSFDIDPVVKPIAEKFNLSWVKNEWKFKPSEIDIHDLKYNDFSYIVTRSDGSSIQLTDTADTVINTSCEHIENFDEWYSKIPQGRLVVLQSNDYDDIDEHVNTSANLYEFAVQTPMSEVYYSGEMEFDKYMRFMRIGIK